MKKIYIVSIIMFSLILSLCGCATNEDYVSNKEALNKQTADLNALENETPQRNIAYELTTKGDYNKLAYSFNELISDADLVLKIEVKNARAFINENGMIQTEITPIIKDIYKGTYNDEKLYVNGGEMLYDEFCENEIIKKAISGHENPENKNDLYGKYVRQSVDEQYIFHAGEEYIFFAEKRPRTEKYHSLYAYQGTFKIVDGIVENTALDDEEPLKENLRNLLSTSIASDEKNISNNPYTKSIASEAAFVEQIKNLTN